MIDTGFFCYLQKVVSCKKIPTGLLLQVDEEFLRAEAVRNDVIRLKISVQGKFDEEPTHSACFKPLKNVKFSVRETRDTITISTSEMEVRITKKPFSIDAYRTDGTVIFESFREKDGTVKAYGFLNNTFHIRRKCTHQDAFYGLGEKSGSFNRAHKQLRLWNCDVCAPNEDKEITISNPDPLKNKLSIEFDPYYISIPFFYHQPWSHSQSDSDPAPMGGFFIDNSYEALFDFSYKGDTFESGPVVSYEMAFKGGQYTEYIMAGPAMKQILDAYTWITGRMQAPPIWALGNHQCRWLDYGQQNFLKLGAQFRDKNIPCDVLWLDIDYMNEYRVFTWNKEKFPDVKGMLDKLRKDGFRVITIIDPGVKYDPGYPVFDEGIKNNLFCKTENGQIYIGQVWPGRTAFPDFSKPETRAWWGKLNAGHVKSGLAGIWNDMNEPATGEVQPREMRFDRDGENHPHERFHNQYATLMAMGTVEGLLKAIPGMRTFVLSRAGSAGIQRYAANWMGDNMSRWDHILMSIRMGVGLGISGQPFVGADVGGFGESSNGELLARWVEYAVLTPFFRNHFVSGYDQYPWSFGKEVENIYRKQIEFRYKLMPYIYSTFIEASETAAPIQRPLLYEFPNERALRTMDDQYLFGGSILVAPIYTSKTLHRQVYLPDAYWYDYHTDQVIRGGRTITADAPLDRIPLYVRAGSIIPMWPEAPTTTMGYQPKKIELHFYLPKREGVSTFTLREDDGLTFGLHKGECINTTFTVTRKKGVITLDADVRGKGYKGFVRKEFTLIVHGVNHRFEFELDGNPVSLTEESQLDLANDGKSFKLKITPI